MTHRACALLVLLAASAGCASTSSARRGRGAAVRDADRSQQGEASFYSDSLAGHHTASGVPYDPDALTAAHRTLPFGTRIRVTRVDNARTVVVVVNDRGPYAGRHRIVDLSRRAARALEMERRGVVEVRLEVIASGGDERR